MKHKITLLSIVAMIALVFPLVFTAGSAQAGYYPMDGANITASGQWAVTDPGYCTDGAGDLVDTAHATPGDSATCQAYAYADSASCSGSLTAKCTDGSGRTDASCTSDGYKLVKSRSWTSHDGNVTTACYATFTNEKTYGTGLWGDDPVKQDNKSTNGCLHCHNNAYMAVRAQSHKCTAQEITDGVCTAGQVDPDYLHADGSYYRAMEGFMKTGHKNVARKVDAPNPMGGPLFTGGVSGTSPYTSINWADGKDAATDTNSIYYIYNSFFSNVNQAKLTRGATLADPTTVSTISNASGVRGCFYCHTGGYDLADTASQIYPLASETSMSGAKTWGWTGVQCYACHRHINDVDDGHHGTAIHEEDPTVTAMCAECHRKETQKRYDLLTDADAPLEVEEIANHHSGFAGEFLNSPHAKFTGTYGQIADNSKYNSHFASGGVNYGCTGCHDVHYGTVDPEVMDPTSPVSHIKDTGTCGISCHGYIPLQIGKINHPFGANTPLDGDLSTNKGVLRACETCHMGGPLTQHFFRINTDANYDTESGGVLNTYDDGEIGLDVNYVCGQCHGGGTDEANPFKPKLSAAPYYSKADLSELAENMHNTFPTAKFTFAADSSIPFMVNFNANTSICPVSVTCTYTWNFGDGSSTATGLTVNHTYADGTAHDVTLTLSTNAHTTSTAIHAVTPTDVHQAPTCGGSVDMTSANVNQVVTLTDASTADSAAGVYVNWGDGSGMANAALDGSVSHSYIWPGNYTVTTIVQDDLGFNCSYKDYVKIVSAGVNPGEGTITMTTDVSVPTSYYVKGLDNWGNLVTKASGSFSTGSATVSLAPGDYEVYLYFGFGHSCTFTQGQTATVVDATDTPVAATGCN